MDGWFLGWRVLKGCSVDHCYYYYYYCYYYYTTTTTTTILLLLLLLYYYYYYYCDNNNNNYYYYYYYITTTTTTTKKKETIINNSTTPLTTHGLLRTILLHAQMLPQLCATSRPCLRDPRVEVSIYFKEHGVVGNLSVSAPKASDGEYHERDSST